MTAMFIEMKKKKIGFLLHQPSSVLMSEEGIKGFKGCLNHIHLLSEDTAKQGSHRQLVKMSRA